MGIVTRWEVELERVMGSGMDGKILMGIGKQRHSPISLFSESAFHGDLSCLHINFMIEPFRQRTI